MAAQTCGNIPVSRVSPKYLHSNSTSHTWAFSAIAELIDNAYDPDVGAKNFWIDKTVIKEKVCLTFGDNGVGMNYQKMYNMLSFGFSDKEAKDDHTPVGRYGNGFKSGSMRLGKDAIVFSKTKETMCVGLLSQTYLEEIGAENVIVPIVTFTCNGKNQSILTQHADCLKDILEHSLFQNEEELKSEFKAINTPSRTSDKTGTRIIIWNLRKTSERPTEFDFDEDSYDIRIPADESEDKKKNFGKPERFMESTPESDFSLRAYCSILYMKPRMQIIIRKKKVQTQLISKSLAFTRKDYYKPTFLKPKSVLITFGYNTKSKQHYGLMMYNNNRLIKAYKRVGCQLQANNQGVGVIGVIECDFLKPTHNKQDFDDTEQYRKTIYNVAGKLKEYWDEVRHKKSSGNPDSSVSVEDMVESPDQNWVQCDDCMKWRKIPDGFDCDLLPRKWFCHMNPDNQFRSCDIPEEKEDSGDEEQPDPKPFKQQEKQKQRERRKQTETSVQTPSPQKRTGSTSSQSDFGTPMSLRKRRPHKELNNDDDDDDVGEGDDSMADTNQKRRRSKRPLTSDKGNKEVKRTKRTDGGHVNVSETPSIVNSVPEVHTTAMSLSTTNDVDEELSDSIKRERQERQIECDNVKREREERQIECDDVKRERQERQIECDDVKRERQERQIDCDDNKRERQEELNGSERALTFGKENTEVKRTKQSDGGNTDNSETPSTLNPVPELHTITPSLNTANDVEEEKNGCEDSLNNGQEEQSVSKDSLMERQEEHSGCDDIKIERQEESIECDNIMKQGQEEQIGCNNIMKEGQEERNGSGDGIMKEGQGEQIRCNDIKKEGQEEQIGCDDIMKEGQEEKNGSGDDIMKEGQEEQIGCDDIMKEGKEEQIECNDIMKEGQEEQIRCNNIMKEGQEEQIGCNNIMKEGQEEQNDCDGIVKQGQEEKNGCGNVLREGEEEQPMLCGELEKLLTLAQSSLLGMKEQRELVNIVRKTLYNFQKQIHSLREQLEEVQFTNRREQQEEPTEY
ncbi:MORC family CW-type zinc finger protein 3-like [Chanos chanos]|uniref:MORC family CW-type zinc finger protein 3-like n=1 Tax=Chanos chanos TaxID=29144 RepID=A0A6J2UUU8_CHACN|nr:MORC family CW-type zinc finger protein 3-like [Chanos chanos]